MTRAKVSAVIERWSDYGTELVAFMHRVCRGLDLQPPGQASRRPGVATGS